MERLKWLPIHLCSFLLPGLLKKGLLTKVEANDLVMAWAQVHRTGSLRYILELGPHGRGTKCNCVYISCGQPLRAVNAAKDVFRVRPHFHHPDGSTKDACMVLAARTALMEALLAEDTLLLPRRRRNGRFEGLCGDFHEAWVRTATRASTHCKR